MSEHIWFPIDADYDGCGMFEIVYRNERGDEFVHVVDSWENSPHALCWKNCSGDWPGCKMSCPLFTGPMEELVAEQKKYEEIPPRDPFSFMLNRERYIDDNNCYVEAFDTLDGSHWEIAVDINDWLLELLDEETSDDDN